MIEKVGSGSKLSLLIITRIGGDIFGVVMIFMRQTTTGVSHLKTELNLCCCSQNDGWLGAGGHEMLITARPVCEILRTVRLWPEAISTHTLLLSKG